MEVTVSDYKLVSQEDSLTRYHEANIGRLFAMTLIGQGIGKVKRTLIATPVPHKYQQEGLQSQYMYLAPTPPWNFCDDPAITSAIV